MEEEIFQYENRFPEVDFLSLELFAQSDLEYATKIGFYKLVYVNLRLIVF